MVNSKRIVAMIATVLAIVLLTNTSAAQDDTQTVAPVSGRYSLQVPASWSTSSVEVRGLSGTFAREIVAVAENNEALAALQSNNRTDAIAGRTLIANVFPTVGATQGQQLDDANAIFEVILRDDATAAQYFDVNGLPAVSVDTYTGPPYENNENAGLTMILDGNLIYFIVYSAPDSEGLRELADMAATLQANTLDESQLLAATALGTSQDFVVNRLRIPMIDGWMVLTSGPPVPGIPQMFMIIPEPTRTLDRLIIPFFDEEAVPGMYVQVQTHAYDARFGTADYTPTDEDRSQLLGETLATTGGTPVLGTEQLFVAGQPALLLRVENVFGGENVGQIVLIDGDDTLYTLTFVGPASTWQANYAALSDALINSLELDPAGFVTIETDGVPIGVQVGQRAPDFTLQSLQGEALTLSDFRGQIVLLNFWATWCAPCRVEMPAFELIANQRDDVAVVAVNLLESNEQVQAFVDELGLTFNIAMDVDAETNDLFRVMAYPTTFILDAEGMIEIVHAGPVTAAQVEEWLAIAGSQ